MEIEQKERERIEEWAEIHFGKYGVQAVATAITSKQAEHQHLQKEVIQPMQSVMIAAAEEIMRVWPPRS